ncbi:hydrolase [Bacillus phage Beyonphe]|nr:hydrolase [Bacillus phage Beyonphe]
MLRDSMYDGSPEKKIREMEMDLLSAVKTVNGKAPDDKGNVQVDGAPTGDFATKDDIKGMVKSVNGTKPGTDGDVKITIPSTTGFIKTINSSLTPDANGKVTGLVQSVNGNNPDATGKVTVPLITSGAARPTTGTYVGQPFFDTTLNKPIWRNKDNNGWVDATGAAVV